jgi:hypothetical protein
LHEDEIVVNNKLKAVLKIELEPRQDKKNSLPHVMGHVMGLHAWGPTNLLSNGYLGLFLQR